MNHQPHRVSKLLGTGVVVALSAALLTGGARAQTTAPAPVSHAMTAPGDALPAVTVHLDHTDLGKWRWQYACRTSTFPQMTFFGMIDYLHALVIHHLELSPGQALSPDHPDIKVGPDMAPADLAALVAKLKAVRMDVVSYEAADLGRDPIADRKVFAFGKALGIKNIVGNPADGSLAALDKLATEYGINVAIRNGAKPGSHWQDAALLKALAGCSARIGVCADAANWQRSGVSPLKSLQTLQGHVMEISLSDVDAKHQEVPLGRGSVDVPGILAYLKAQNFVGVFAIGYGGSGSAPERAGHWAESVNTFSDDLAKLAAATAIPNATSVMGSP